MAAHTLPWDTQWDLVRAADPVVDPSAHRVTFGLQQGRAGGRAPVNRYFGTLGEGVEGSLVLGPMATTMMAGSPRAMAAESAYFALLARVHSGWVQEGKLVLVDEAGAELLAFEPSADPT